MYRTVDFRGVTEVLKVYGKRGNKTGEVAISNVTHVDYKITATAGLTVVIIEGCGNVFAGKTICRIGNNEASFSDGTITDEDYFDSSVKGSVIS